MSEGELDFDADELAMLRQLFRSEAQDALETVTARLRHIPRRPCRRSDPRAAIPWPPSVRSR